MATVQLTSAAGVLSLLEEPEPELQTHALQTLNDMVDHYWLEIAAAIPSIETLYDNEDFKDRELAAAVASKVFYHLEELDDALKYALGAGNLFDVTSESEYVTTLVSKCIDEYIERRVQHHDRKARHPEDEFEEKIDPRLENVVDRMFQRCFDDGEFKQAMGIAIESRRLDMVRKTIELVPSTDRDLMLKYCFNLALTVVPSKEFRHELLEALVELYKGRSVPDYINMCQCLLYLDDYTTAADTLTTLIVSSDEGDHLMAYQVAFDLYENENLVFLKRVRDAISDKDENGESLGPIAEEKIKKLKSILSGDIPTELHLQFLYSQNKSDLNILKQIKEKIDVRNSVTHNATVMAHAIMHVGTTVDTFLRDDLEWLGKASNWAKFTATASIGVIHRGHHKESLKLLQPYLPQPGQSGSPYQEGGALFALGLIHANHSGDKLQYLLNALSNAGPNEIVQHGACLGIGLMAMGSHNAEVFETIKDSVLYTDSAVAGEAAGLAMGLIMLGSGDADAAEEMMSYAKDTNHEKIIRGLSLGLALTCYGQEEEADVLITDMLTCQEDAIIRYGGVHAVAMAYVGTSNNAAIKKLLHIAVSDVSDDVRRGAVMALGFVLCDSPEEVPRIVGLLSESYNPHVRFGACLAVGIACAGQGLKEALDLIEPLLKDQVDYVRQAAFIATAMMLIQHNKHQEPKVQELRNAIDVTISRKGDTMGKLGAILAAGILDAGGRNVTISLLSRGGHKKVGAIVGMMMFPQYWYWYPLANFISLSFTPTALIGLNKDLAIPEDWEVKSNAPASMFAYPAPIEIKKQEKRKKVPTATLSVTAKALAKKKKKEEEEGNSDEKMDIDEETKDESAPMEVDDKKADEDKVTEADSLPKGFTILKNPSRVTWAQQSVIAEQPNRYKAITSKLAGIVLLKDTTPGEKENIYVSKKPTLGVPGVSDDEPAPPAAFQFPE